MNEETQPTDDRTIPEDTRYWLAILAGAAVSAMLMHTTAGEGASIIVPVFVILGGLMAWTSAMAASVGGGSTASFGFGLGIMTGPLFYLIASMGFVALKLFAEVASFL